MTDRKRFLAGLVAMLCLTTSILIFVLLKKFGVLPSIEKAQGRNFFAFNIGSNNQKTVDLDELTRTVTDFAEKQKRPLVKTGINPGTQPLAAMQFTNIPGDNELQFTNWDYSLRLAPGSYLISYGGETTRIPLNLAIVDAASDSVVLPSFFTSFDSYEKGGHSFVLNVPSDAKHEFQLKSFSPHDSELFNQGIFSVVSLDSVNKNISSLYWTVPRDAYSTEMTTVEALVMVLNGQITAESNKQRDNWEKWSKETGKWTYTIANLQDNNASPKVENSYLRINSNTLYPDKQGTANFLRMNDSSCFCLKGRDFRDLDSTDPENLFISITVDFAYLKELATGTAINNNLYMPNVFHLFSKQKGFKLSLLKEIAGYNQQHTLYAALNLAYNEPEIKVGLPYTAEYDFTTAEIKISLAATGSTPKQSTLNLKVTNTAKVTTSNSVVLDESKVKLYLKRSFTVIDQVYIGHSTHWFASPSNIMVSKFRLTGSGNEYIKSSPYIIEENIVDKIFSTSRPIHVVIDGRALQGMPQYEFLSFNSSWSDSRYVNNGLVFTGTGTTSNGSGNFIKMPSFYFYRYDGFTWVAVVSFDKPGNSQRVFEFPDTTGQKDPKYGSLSFGLNNNGQIAFTIRYTYMFVDFEDQTTAPLDLVSYGTKRVYIGSMNSQRFSLEIREIDGTKLWSETKNFSYELTTPFETIPYMYLGRSLYPNDSASNITLFQFVTFNGTLETARLNEIATFLSGR